MLKLTTIVIMSKSTKNLQLYISEKRQIGLALINNPNISLSKAQNTLTVRVCFGASKNIV
jgi:hypothetical protein